MRAGIATRSGGIETSHPGSAASRRFLPIPFGVIFGLILARAFLLATHTFMDPVLADYRQLVLTS